MNIIWFTKEKEITFDQLFKDNFVQLEQNATKLVWREWQTNSEEATRDKKEKGWKRLAQIYIDSCEDLSNFFKIFWVITFLATQSFHHQVQFCIYNICFRDVWHFRPLKTKVLFVEKQRNTNVHGSLLPNFLWKQIKIVKKIFLMLWRRGKQFNLLESSTK